MRIKQITKHLALDTYKLEILFEPIRTPIGEMPPRLEKLCYHLTTSTLGEQGEMFNPFEAYTTSAPNTIILEPYFKGLEDEYTEAESGSDYVDLMVQAAVLLIGKVIPKFPPYMFPVTNGVRTYTKSSLCDTIHDKLFKESDMSEQQSRYITSENGKESVIVNVAPLIGETQWRYNDYVQHLISHLAGVTEVSPITGKKSLLLEVVNTEMLDNNTVNISVNPANTSEFLTWDGSNWIRNNEFIKLIDRILKEYSVAEAEAVVQAE